MHLFIIPGNPPALYFYKLWAEEIQHEHGECSIHISPYPRLSPHANSLQYLSEIAAFHTQELLAFHQVAKKKVIVIGHSLGAWMALRLLEDQGTIIKNCLLLYPFLQRPSLKGRAILQTMRYFYKVPFIVDLLLSCRSLFERFIKDLKSVTDEELYTSFALAYHEHQVIGLYKGTLQIPEQMREKLHMIYCDQDTWCPSHTVNEMKKWISCEKIDSTHAFITSKQERVTVLTALFHRVCCSNQNF